MLEQFMYTKKTTSFSVNVLLIVTVAFLAQSAFAQEDVQTDATATQAAVTLDSSEASSNQPMVEVTAKALSSQTQNRITNLAANISNRMEAMIERLSAIALRVESRMLKLKASGYSVDNTFVSINETRLSLSEARTILSTIDTKVYTMVSSENPQQEWVNVRDTFVAVHTHLSSAKESLRRAVTEMQNAAISETNQTVTTGSQSEELISQ